MRRTPSCRTTILWSFLLPILAMCGLSGGLLLCWLGKITDNEGKRLIVEGLWVFTLMWALVMVGLVRTLGFLKRVEVDEDALYVSHYISEARIPLSEVDRICTLCRHIPRNAGRCGAIMGSLLALPAELKSIL